MSPLSEMSRRTQLIAGAAVVAVIALVVGGVLMFRSGEEVEDTATTVPETTTTTERVPGPTAPLTGLEDPTGAVATRCAVSVKIGNTADAHPQTGVGAADVVYEEVVDGGITRLVAVYQSTAPEQVGGVRSVRPTDQYILWPLRGVFAFSGGNPAELASLKGVPVVKLDETAAGGMMFRGPGRAPNNLFADVNQMYGACEDPPPPPLFLYRPPLTASAGLPAAAADVGFAKGYETNWTWDPARALWLRSIFGGPDVDPDGRQIARGQRGGHAGPLRPRPHPHLGRGPDGRLGARRRLQRRQGRHRRVGPPRHREGGRAARRAPARRSCSPRARRGSSSCRSATPSPPSRAEADRPTAGTTTSRQIEGSSKRPAARPMRVSSSARLMASSITARLRPASLAS